MTQVTQDMHHIFVIVRTSVLRFVPVDSHINDVDPGSKFNYIEANAVQLL